MVMGRACNAYILILASIAFAANFVVSDHKPTSQEHTGSADDLIDWLRANGATAPLRVGPVNGGEGLRGTIAKKDIAAGEVVALLPNNLTIDIADYRKPGAELAVHLLRMQLSDPAWNASFSPYWRSLPAQGTVYSKEVWSTDPEHLALLQNVYMAHYVEVNSNWTDSVFAGTAEVPGEEQFPHLLEEGVPGAEHITLDQFRHLAALAATYSFVFPNQEGHYMRVLLPLLDLSNHRGHGSNAYVTRDEVTGAVNFIANLDIKEGEEVTHTYNWDNERNDYSLINYFFLQTSDPPMLCALDLPNGSLDGNFEQADDHYLPHEKGALQALVQSMEARLQMFATTEVEDEALLSKSELGTALDWRDQRVIEFRRERKRALRYTIERLRERERTAYKLLTTPGSTWVPAKEEL